MAEKRMFSKTIIDSDAFLDMPMSSQNLYFHLNMRADDDGFVNSPKKILRIIGASQDDMKILLAKRYLLEFESGVIVIKHWRLHNTLRKDRYKETIYQKEKSQLFMKKNGAYTDRQPTGNQLATNWQPSIDKISIDKNREEEIRIEDRNFVSEYEELRNYWNTNGLPEYRKLLPYHSNPKEIANSMQVYTLDEMRNAIDNYQGSETEFKYGTFVNFLLRGLDQYHDGAYNKTREKTPREIAAEAIADAKRRAASES